MPAAIQLNSSIENSLWIKQSRSHELGDSSTITIDLLAPKTFNLTNNQIHIANPFDNNGKIALPEINKYTERQGEISNASSSNFFANTPFSVLIPTNSKNVILVTPVTERIPYFIATSSAQKTITKTPLTISSTDDLKTKATRSHHTVENLKTQSLLGNFFTVSDTSLQTTLQFELHDKLLTMLTTKVTTKLTQPSTTISYQIQCAKTKIETARNLHPNPFCSCSPGKMLINNDCQGFFLFHLKTFWRFNSFLFF